MLPPSKALPMNNQQRYGMPFLNWVYRQVQKGRIRAITGFGAAMIPASEIERIFGPTEAAATCGAGE